MSASPRDEIDHATIQLLLQEPFYGHYVLGLRKQLTENAPGIAVSVDDDGTACLKIAPSYWAGLTGPRRLGALKHEMLHLVFRHPTRRAEFGDAALFNLCADLVVNQHLGPAQLREDDPTLDDFEGLAPDQTVEWYYAHLLERLQGAPGGGGAGEPAAGEGQAAHGGQAPGEGQAPDARLGAHLDPRAGPQARHRPWASVDALDSLQRNLLESSLDAHLDETMARVPDWTDLPGALGRLLAQRAGLAASLDWRRVLRLFATSAAATTLKDTLHRPSKRYHTVPGLKVKSRRRIALAFDTSGSLGDEDLALFVSEMRHIWRTGAEVEVIECDAAVQRTYPFRGRAPQHVAGGGGTCFDPALALANRWMPDALVYFTDGYAPAPTVAPRCPVLWMIASHGAPLEAEEIQRLPGRKARLVKVP